ncbi:MAG: efflux RND transporter permease subunit [Rhodoferax sp.]|uniref:efflux RND transporter permease subunit n=1 Tax=Rhodoferax sp. TaxID=50421 RepID=UPI0017D66346|nr:efflux RND transporter permease subunit [Rhodoferax sp.]NMM18920.1 efflux RND transporter permease subunit [Rhodoferax sp.]
MDMKDKPSIGISGRIAAAFQTNALTPLLALVALLLGLFAVLVTPREEEPQINVTMADVLIPFPGASSVDVQNMVARPAEQVLSQIAGIEHTYSVARPGLAVLTVQFKVGVPRTEALVRLYDVLNANQDWLPRDLGTLSPIVKPKGIDDVPVLGVTLWSREALPAYELERVAHAVETELKRVPGTREVQTIGGPGRAVHVWLDPARLRDRGIDIMSLKQTLAAANFGMPSGAVLDATTPSGQMLSIEAGEFLRSAQDVGDLVVGVSKGLPVYLREVARVESGAQIPQRYVWFTPGGAAAQPVTSTSEKVGADKAPPAATAMVAGSVYPAVTITVTKKPGENAVDVAQAVRERIKALSNTVIPANMETTITRDYGETAAEKANKLIQKLAFATGSVILLVGFALGRREAVIVGAAVILTLMATLFASWAWGFTLNRVSLFALIFSIGILVDDAIVVVENIHRHQKLTPDATLKEIIPRAVDEVGGPTILATLTVIAALLPMAFVSGLMGPYMSPIPINSSLGMAISLAIAFTVTPWLALKLMKPQGHAPADPASAKGLGPKLQTLFTRVLTPLLDSARKRWLLLAGILVALLLSVGLTLVEWVVMKMLPFDNKSEFQVVVEMPAGTPLENTAATLHELGAFLAQQPDVLNLQAYAGTASPITFNGLVRQYYLRADAEQGDLQVNLVDKHHRSEKSHVIAQRLRPDLEKIGLRHNARIKVVEVPPGPPVMSPLMAEVYGPDEAGRQQVASRVAKAFAGTPDIVGIDTSLKENAPRAFLRVRRQQAESLGIPVSVIAQSAAMALSGTDAAYLHDGQSKYPVPVRLQLPQTSQIGLDALLAIPLRAANGQMVPLSELVQIERGVIDKPLFTKDLQGLSYVFGDMAGKLDSPLYGLFAIRDKLAAAALPGTGKLGEYWIHQPADPYREYAIKWDGEWQITYETFRDMGAAYGVGLILIYLLVVAQFRSYLTPLVIMAPIPLTLIGVMPGHALLGSQFTATSMIGMIALAGIIVRNSILLVDFIELQVRQGLPFKDAVVQSAAVRAQPIALTGLAAMIGAFFILDDPIFNGLAITLIFGILVSTLLTLVVIPVLYYALFRRRMESRADANAPKVHPT